MGWARGGGEDFSCSIFFMLVYSSSRAFAVFVRTGCVFDNDDGWTTTEETDLFQLQFHSTEDSLFWGEIEEKFSKEFLALFSAVKVKPFSFDEDGSVVSGCD